jgi:mRNA-degrading endonuclease RelE of RelBE toxin-antitoxin system
MIFIESPVFSADLLELLSDDEYSAFQRYLIANPHAGDVIQGTGGLRKVRWAAGGKGKSGGVRVIYFHVDELEQIQLLLIYKKGIKDDLTEREKSILRGIKDRWT